MMINQGMWNDNPFDSWTEEEEHLSNMGVISFGKGGGPPPTPAHTTTQTTSQYPDELKPFIQDIFGKAKGIEDQRSADGYQAYDAPRIAGFNQDQQNAFTGIRNAQGASTPYFEAQETLIDRSTAGPSAARTAQYMNPYTQNVIDIQQRELGRMGAQERQRIGAGAVGAGGYGGSRQAILEAEQMRNQGMRSDDIQARGMNQAFAQAQQAMAQADARGLQGAGMYGQMATQVPGQRMKELGALAGVGAADQTQQQRALDLGYQQFQDEYNYPMKTLNDYSAILRGFPLPANTSSNQTAYSAVAPLSSQLLGAGAGLTGMAGMAGLFGASGGQVKKLQQGGLASMYAPSNRVRMGKTNYADGDEIIEEEVVEEYKPKNMFDAGLNLFRPDEIKGLSIYEAMQKLNNSKSTISDGEARDEVNRIESLTPEERIEDEENRMIYRDADGNIMEPPKVPFYDINNNDINDPNYIPPEQKEIKEEIDEVNISTNVEEQPDYNKFMNWYKDQSKDKGKEERMRFATWGPVLANASKIMSAPDLSSAVGALFDTGAKVAQSYIGQKGSETSMAAAVRKSTLEGAKTMSEIVENLTPTAAYVAASTSIDKLIASNNGLVPDSSQPDLLETYNRLIAQREIIAGKMSDPELDQLSKAAMRSLRPPVGLLIDDVEDETFKTIYNEWKNSGAPGPETMAAGGKIRSFDFVEQGDTLVAVPKLT
tara:strand:- start:839 stop:2971 length:2133 start_codon:yes stop_codon:yes gene_type:complete